MRSTRVDTSIIWKTLCERDAHEFRPVAVVGFRNVGVGVESESSIFLQLHAGTCMRGLVLAMLSVLSVGSIGEGSCGHRMLALRVARVKSSQAVFGQAAYMG